MITSSDLAALRTLLARATPGEWRVSDGDCWAVESGDQAIAQCLCDDEGEEDSAQGVADAELIASIKNALPALLDA